MASNPESQPSLVQFTLFPSLPAELRIKIWNESFLPRVVELHSQRFTVRKGRKWVLNDKVLIRYMEKIEWVSNCSNPAALSVCSESRTLAQNRYSVLLPVFRARSGKCIPRTLYFDPSSDLLAVLGKANFMRLVELFRIIQEQDPSEQGVRRFGLSIGYQSQLAGLEFLVCWDKVLFDQLQEFVLLMYDEERPPATFRDGECALEKAEGMDAFSRVLSMSLRKSYDSGRLRVMNLQFIPGPVSRRAIKSSGVTV
ncbi:hypothetical protein F5Y06DRAFT_150314 [Hypoxylon sp. FL0890]|nr:hypothetical protein F5Y06DRAFT_150314 [Hypoxylon sp. FL0890]